MKEKLKDKSGLDFQMQKSPYAPILVNRFFADGSTSVIGQVFQKIDNEDTLPIYLSMNTNGEELFPPSEEWSLVEDSFKKYVKTISEKENELNELRENKKAKNKNINR